MGVPVKTLNSKFRVGSSTVGVTAQQLTANSFEIIKSVRIKCTSGTIYIGTNSSVSASNGYILAASWYEYIDIAIDDPSKIWIIGASPGQAYCWIAS